MYFSNKSQDENRAHFRIFTTLKSYSFNLFPDGFYMASITITTPFNIDLEFKTASVNKRLLAWLIDILIITLYYYVILRFIKPLLGLTESIDTAAELFLIILPVLLYQLAFELFLNGQTIGKKLVGIKVIDMEGKEPTWGQYILRWLLCIGNLFVYIIPYVLLRVPVALIAFMILYLPDFLCVIISAKSQRIGDLAAGTVVIDKNYVANISDTIYFDVGQESYKPVFPGVMRLTDRDINGISNLISNKRTTRDTELYMQQVTDKIKSVLTIESDLEPYAFLQQLLLDYNYYTGKSATNATPLNP